MPKVESTPSVSLWSFRWWDPFGYVAISLKNSIAAKVAEFQLNQSAQILDYGCGDKPYRRLFPMECTYLGADLPGNSDADLAIDADGRVPVTDASCDLVLSSQVLEHVGDPALYLNECRRVLKPGGKLLLTTHGLMFWHPHPRDFWRWTAEGLNLIVERAGMRVVAMEGIVGLVPTATWLAMFCIQHRLPWGLRHMFVLIGNLFIYFSDRFTSDDARLRDAYIYSLVAERPQD